jgi:WD40 repeat protein
MMLWDLDAQAPWRWQVPRPDPAPTISGDTVLALDLSQNGLLARSISRYPNLQTSTVDIWDTNTGFRVGPITVDGLVDSLGISDDGTQLALNVISPDQITLDLAMIDVRTGAARWQAVAHPGATTGTFDDTQQNFSSWVKFSEDGTLVSSIVSRSTVGAIATLDSTTGALAPSNGVGRDRTVMDVSDDLRYLILAAGVDDPGGPWGTVAPTEVVEAATGDVLASFETDFAPLGQQSMPIRPNSTEFAIQRNPGRIIVRDWASVGVEPYATVTPEQRFGAQVAVQLDGTVIDLTEPMSRLGLKTGSTQEATAVASPSGQVAISTGSTIEIWDPGTGQFVRSVDMQTGCRPWYGPKSMAFTGSGDDGSVVVKCDGRVVSWDLASTDRTPRWTQPVPNQAYASSLVVSPDGSRVVAPTGYSSQLLDGATGELIGESPGAAINVAFSPDGTVVAAVSWPGDVTLFDADDFTVIKTLVPSGGAANDGGLQDQGSPALALSPDNDYVAAWHWNDGVEVWNVESGESMAVIDGRRDYRPSAPSDTPAAYNLVPGGIVFPTATLSFDGAGTGLDLNVVQTFSTGGGAGFHRALGTQWSLSDDALTETACRIVGRDLTEDEWAKYIGDSVPYRATCSTA